MACLQSESSAAEDEDMEEAAVPANVPDVPKIAASVEPIVKTIVEYQTME